MKLDTFRQSSNTQDAVARNIEAVGETAAMHRDATLNLPPNALRRRVEERSACETQRRNAYLNLDFEIVWQTFRSDPPAFWSGFIAADAASPITLVESNADGDPR